ncbi:MAG TPA: hypothetical protein VGO97_03040 [Solirubrobacterales bacterium]|jgi:uncharacterized membrane protein|nr:hypothetical protein [Solirubrobacterales bacterium]
MDTVITAAGAAIAVAVELIEALAIVLAVGISRRWRDALIGATAAVIVCTILAIVLGPVVLARVGLDTLRVVVGLFLILFGLEWLRKGTLRLAGRRARSSAVAEFEEAEAELADEPLPPEGEADWAGRTVAFKGVLLEGIEIVLIVSALAARPSGRTAVLVGSAIAALLTLVAGIALRRPLANLPETEMKWGVGVLLTTFGVFFFGEGLGVHWPGGDAVLVGLAVLFAGVSQIQIRLLSARRIAPPGAFA